MKNIRFFSVMIISSVLASKLAHAQTFSPTLNALISFEVQNDTVTDSDDTDAEVNTATTTIEPYVILSLTERLALEGGFVLEQVQDPDAGDDTFFDNEGAYVEQLKATYTSENWGIFAGKYNPTFGTAWDLAPGIYGADFAEDYELTERIGFGGSYNIGSEQVGSHTITGNTFFLDTSGLSESTITQRGQTKENDGGPSNTEDFSSFSVTLDSEAIAGVEGLNTHVGFYSQSDGDADVGLGNETGYALGANYTLAISDDVEANALGECVVIQDSAGGNDDVNYLTTSLGLTVYDNWNFAVSRTSRDTDVVGDADEDGEEDPNLDDYIFQFSAGYTFDNGFSVDIGYRGSQESDVDTDIVGALVAYTYEF